MVGFFYILFRNPSCYVYVIHGGTVHYPNSMSNAGLRACVLPTMVMLLLWLCP